ncbi:carbohydrate ABC transporter permease [Helcococcus ovis]|uniref:Carbohydrate ABC transporter permease n=1 Tax=Helcococcus ovis TaxID=72026 RepID=A0A4V3IY59_9FIRM|nr:carbohydrate ABC transporter permease [Helcococcus ovis]TFF64098.1 carbohydrate ABC transporter permease [Helcococcus ovis]TFF64850.1 carbohydrate ABC transporter permease [Helcococcus ovis]
MAKKKLKSSIAISGGTNILFNILLFLIAAMCIFPLLYVFSISISTKESIAQYGYQIIPKEISLASYKQILGNGSSILNAFKNSVILTIVGTILGTFTIITYAYAMSRNDFLYRRFFNTIAFIPMLFGGGMVASYIVMVNILGLKNTPLALLLPLLFNTFYLVIMRTFFQTSVPFALIEAAMVDGANEFDIFFKIVLPISLPGIATISLFLTLAYWNDWFNAMIYLDDTFSPYSTLQYMLIKIQRTLEVVILKNSQMGPAAMEALKSLPTDGIRMAIVVVTTFPIALSYPFFQRYFVQGLTLGAVKE